MERIQKYIILAGVLVLIVMNTLSTCTHSKFRESIDKSINLIRESQQHLTSAVSKIDSAQASARVSIDTLNALRDRLSKIQQEVQGINDAYKKSREAGLAQVKEVEKHLSDEQQRLEKYKR